MAFVFVIAALGTYGCDSTTSNPDDSAADVTDNSDKADGVVRPEGTYTHAAAAAGDFTVVILNADKSFHREMLVMCITTPCNPVATDGTYGWSKSGSTRYVRFLDANGALIDRYAYTLSGDVLTLRTPDTNHTQKLKLTTVTTPCAAAGGSCVGLYPGACANGTVGDANTYGCGGGVGVMCCLPPQNTCQTAGGTCVPLVPDACANGTLGDATTYSCGGGVGVQCCLPPQNPCQTAGGTCVPLVPDACANGTLGDANTYGCGSGVGVQCCLPPTFNACQHAGGTCVPLVPDACANGTLGDATTYRCGVGVGVQCCLP
jgi:hypothetical protein